jgi:hypothetical protein
MAPIMCLARPSWSEADMNATRSRDFAALGVTVQIAGETLFELLAFALYGTADMALEAKVLVRAGVYLACLVLLPRLSRRIPFNPDAE